VIQPIYGGYFVPTLYLRSGKYDNVEPFAKVEGPTCFGGWMDMCVNFRFFVSSYKSEPKSGDLAVFTKQKPTNLATSARELFTDAEVFTIDYASYQSATDHNSNSHSKMKLNASEKLTILAAQMLADYMFFDGNTEKCSSDDNGTHCYCCYMYCCGRLCPFYISIPKNQK
jgi:hypothetical protein